MSFNRIFTNGKIGKLRIQNRVIMSPMNVGGNNESDGCLSQRGIDYFVERAKGGVGMIVTGAVRVTRQFERDSSTIPLWMLFVDHMVHTKWMSELAERCHDYGTKVCIQLTAGGGRIAGAYAQTHNLAIGPSENPCFYPPHLPCRELTKEEIKAFITAFEQAARFAKNAGIDAIQLHGHQGYLLDQFSTSLWNHRTDEYGGSLENRLRFAKEILEAIKRGADADFPVIYRYGLTHFLEGGRSIDEGVEMAKLLQSFGFDALDIDSGCYENNYYPHPPESIPCGSFAYLAAHVKKAVSIPVISSTRIGYPEIAESILANNQADFVSLGRPLIADPEWCNKAKVGEENAIRPCIACHEGCLRRLFYYKPLSCAVNPLAGNEMYLQIVPATEPKQIVVVGGGVAGMVAAITCSKRGHNVTLYEASGELGGSFESDFLPEFKSDYRRYIEYLKRELTQQHVDIQLNHRVEDFKSISADFIICAVGGEFRTFPIEGLDASRLTNPFELYKDVDFKNKKVAIIGGGLVGVEAAINVAMHNGTPYVIEKFSQIAKTAYPVNRQHLEFLLNEKGIAVYKNADVLRVDNNTIRFKQNEETKTLTFDLISECVGMKSNEYEFPENCIIVGDADHPENVMNAVWSAYRRCRLI